MSATNAVLTVGVVIVAYGAISYLAMKADLYLHKRFGKGLFPQGYWR